MSKNFLEQNIFVECPKTGKLHPVEGCYRCEQAIQISFKNKRIECVKTGTLKHRYVTMKTQVEI